MTERLDTFAQTLIRQGAEYAIAEDKADMSDDRRREAQMEGGLEATERALAAYLGVDMGRAGELILMAASD